MPLKVVGNDRESIFLFIFHEKNSLKSWILLPTYTLWHVSTVVYKWWHLANCKLLQFIKQQKIHFVNKHAMSPIFWKKTQQMAMVVCHSVYLFQCNFLSPLLSQTKKPRNNSFWFLYLGIIQIIRDTFLALFRPCPPPPLVTNFWFWSLIFNLNLLWTIKCKESIFRRLILLSYKTSLPKALKTVFKM